MGIQVGVMGAAGYAGAELVRLVLGHPDMELAAVTSNADAGVALARCIPCLCRRYGSGVYHA